MPEPAKKTSRKGLIAKVIGGTAGAVAGGTAATALAAGTAAMPYVSAPAVLVGRMAGSDAAHATYEKIRDAHKKWKDKRDMKKGHKKVAKDGSKKTDGDHISSAVLTLGAASSLAGHRIKSRVGGHAERLRPKLERGEAVLDRLKYKYGRAMGSDRGQVEARVALAKGKRHLEKLVHSEEFGSNMLNMGAASAGAALAYKGGKAAYKAIKNRMKKGHKKIAKMIKRPPSTNKANNAAELATQATALAGIYKSRSSRNSLPGARDAVTKAKGIRDHVVNYAGDKTQFNSMNKYHRALATAKEKVTNLENAEDLGDNIATGGIAGMAGILAYRGGKAAYKARKKKMNKNHEKTAMYLNFVYSMDKLAALDPVGKEDRDVDNDGDHDKSDKYLMKRRKTISHAIANKARAVGAFAKKHKSKIKGAAIGATAALALTHPGIAANLIGSGVEHAAHGAGELAKGVGHVVSSAAKGVGSAASAASSSAGSSAGNIASGLGSVLKHPATIGAAGAAYGVRRVKKKESPY